MKVKIMTDLDAELLEMLQATKKKKKEKKKKEHENENNNENKEVKQTKEEYIQLLNRLYDKIRSSNPDYNTKQVGVQIPIPVVKIVHGKQINWENFKDVCAKIGRDYQEVARYFYSELETTGSFNQHGHFLINGLFRPKQIQSLLVKYIKQNVQCSKCHSLDTVFKNSYLMECHKCFHVKSNHVNAAV